MAEKRRGLGRGLGALIPSAPSGDARPVDVFFPGAGPTPGTPVAVAERTGDEGEAWRDGDLETADRGPDDDAAEREAGAAGGSDTTAESDQSVVAGPGDPAVAHPADPEVTGGERGVIPRPHEHGYLNSRDVDSGDLDTGDLDGSDLDGSDLDGGDLDGGDLDEGEAARSGSYEHVNRSELVAGDPDHGDRVDGHAADSGDLLPVPGVHFAELPVGSIQPNPRQPRTVFDEDALAELVGSIREIGVLQPVVVRPIDGADPDDVVRYELIMGERRLRATRQAGLATIPAIVRETDDADLLRDALLENLHRSELNALEEAAAYQQLLDDFGCTHDELARRIHRSRPQISNTLRLLRLPPLVQRRVAAGVLSAGHARALLGLPDAASMERLAQRIVAEGLSVRATEEVVTLGGDPARSSVRRARAGDRNAALDDLAARLSDRFETRVSIALGKSKGRLTVEFASVQDLNRILTTLSPDDPGLLR